MCLACVLAACFLPGQAGAAVVLRSGVYGQVLRGPTRPLCEVEQPCDAPAPHLVLLFQLGSRLYRTTTGSDGRFRLALLPGLYRVTLQRHYGIGRGFGPTSVRVPVGRFVRTNFLIDTGIR